MPRSAREIDVDPDTYIGLSFPLRADSNNNFSMTKTSLQQAQHNLKNLLLTHPGERVNQPEFGCRLRELCFEQRDEQLPDRIEEIIKESVSFWLPYINIIDVKTLTDDKNTIFVTLKFSTTLNPNTLEQITLDTSYTSTRY
tara:strand:+ start:843 stop:1265 length:423 start_codon:yes stop_codon:yes gene_type:complete